MIMTKRLCFSMLAISFMMISSAYAGDKDRSGLIVSNTSHSDSNKQKTHMYKISAIFHQPEGCFFDTEHYFNVHAPLVLKQTKAGGLKIIKREFVQNVKYMFDTEKSAPLFIVSYFLESKQDVDDFKAFMDTDLVQPLIEDEEKYSDCVSEWTLAEVVEQE